jgi:acetylornithine deacetylase/succinyl-diaminopimelate desuccinylase-like protein
VADALRGRILIEVAAGQDDIVRDDEHLIQTESVTGHESVVQDYLAGELRKMALSVDQFEPGLDAPRGHPAYIGVEGLSVTARPNVVPTYRGAGGERSLLFNGHVDTIPVAPVGAWALSGAMVDVKVYFPAQRT